jgi:oligopeptide transport system substrate-binding protein
MVVGGAKLRIILGRKSLLITKYFDRGGNTRMKKRIALILAAAMVLMAFLAGCGKKETGGGENTNQTAVSNDKQEITLNLGGDPTSVDPGRASDNTSFIVIGNTYEGLLRTGKNFEPLPGVATEWKVENGVDYTFTLRKDAKWSDGKPVTSKDFKYAWLRVLDPQTASDYAYMLYYIKGAEEFNSLDPKAADFQAKYNELKSKVAIETPDDYTLKVSLKSPTFFFLGLMAFPTYYPVREDIVTQHGEKYGADADKAIYNGPFVIESWTHDDSLILKKNPNYWDAKNVKLEKVTMKMVKDSTTFIQMFEAGELDRTAVTGEFLSKYKNDPTFEQRADATTWWIIFNMQNKYLQNANLRKAINAAVDRKGFVENVLANGSAIPEGVVPPTIAGDGGKTFRQISGSHLSPTANLEEAKKYWEAALKELGVSKLTLKLLTNDSNTGKKYGQGVQEMLQNALPGLTVELEPLSGKIRLERLKQGAFDMSLAGWGADYNDPMTFMDLWITGGSHNDGKYSNPQYDELIKKAQADLNNANRMKYMAEAEKILMNDLPIVPLYHPATNSVSKPWLKGLLTFPIGVEMDLKGAYVEGKNK